MKIRYIANPDDTGWMLTVPAGVSPSVVARDKSQGMSLPWGLKVELLDVSDGREWFRILEGADSIKNKKASVKLKGTTDSYLLSVSPHQEAGLVKLSRKKQQLWYGKEGPFNAFTEATNPISLGRHDIEIPDAPHVNYYPKYSKYE
ncbi:hypothetical protein F0U62_31895 [Cystobacter fuscus]|uniref:hypothetical protein n=1 Tax=Cystobacter fuscus TaxID=43 RepID=UPI002B2B4C46|nr:hypothetical protein F0U62_31895 [Cystobacter fuscus]